MRPIYLDYNATTPLHPAAVDAMTQVLKECYGNPSSAHWAGAAARDVLAHARAQVARLIGAEPETVVFTSSATESNNIVLRSAARAAPQPAGRIVTCATEHPSVLETLEDLDVEADILPVDSDGRLAPASLAEAVGPETLLVSVMWANNETGVVQPIAELASVAADRGVPFHTDAVQALGKLPLELAGLPVDFASFSAHKLGGPKGIGALYVRDGTPLSPLLSGGGQERRLRPGTENVPGIAGFGAACAAAERELPGRGERLGGLASQLWAGIREKIPGVRLNGSLEHRLPHTLNLSFDALDGETLVMALDAEGVAVASGAACHSGSAEPSHVLAAMGVPAELGAGAIRLSLGAQTCAEEIDHALEVLPRVVARVRAAGAA